MQVLFSSQNRAVFGVLALFFCLAAAPAFAGRGVKPPAEWLSQNEAILVQEFGLSGVPKGKVFETRLRSFSPEQLREVNAILESYLGSRKQVALLIEKAPSSWARFVAQNPTKTKALLELIADYLNRDQIAARMQAELSGFAVTDAQKLKGVLEVLSGHLTRDQISARMQVELSGFAVTDAQKLKGVLEVLSRYLTRDQISARMQVELLGFARTDAQKLMGVLEVLSRYLTRDQISARMQADLSGFAKTDAQKLKGVLEVINEYLTRDQISARMQENLLGFAETDAQKLKGVLQVLSEYLTRDQISARMQADLSGFARTDAQKLKAVLEVLSLYLTHDQISARMQVDLLGFAGTDGQKFKGVLEVLSRYLTRDQISARMQAELLGFARTDAQKLQQFLHVLEEYGLTRPEMVIRLEESLKAFCVSVPLLRSRLAFFERFLGHEMTIKRIVGWHPQGEPSRPGSLSAVSLFNQAALSPLIERFAKTVSLHVIREELWKAVGKRFQGIALTEWDHALAALEARYPNALERDFFALENGPKGILHWYRLLYQDSQPPTEAAAARDSGCATLLAIPKE